MLYLVIISALELKVNKQKNPLSLTVPKPFDLSPNSSVLFNLVTFEHPISWVLLKDKLNESCKTSKNLKEMPYPPQKRKEKNIAPAKTNAPVS